MTRFGLALTPMDGEDLTSYLVRVGTHLMIPTGQVLDAVGLGRSWLGREVSDACAARMGSVLGLSDDTVRDLSLTRYPVEVTGSLGGHGGRVRHPGAGWTMLRVVGACPDCIAESPGIWHRDWNLGITFTCLRHDRLLDIRCRACGAPEGKLPAISAHTRPCHHRPATEADRRADDAVRRTIGADTAVRESQRELLELLAESRHDATSAAMLQRARVWLSGFAVVNDSTWPEPTSAPMGLARAHEDARRQTRGGHRRPNHSSEATRPPESPMARAGWAAAAIAAATASRSERQELLDESVRRLTWAGEPGRARSAFTPRDHDLRYPVAIWAGRRKPIDDLRDAATAIADSLTASGLEPRNLPPVLPTLDLPDLRRTMLVSNARVWSAATLAAMTGRSLSASLKLMGVLPTDGSRVSGLTVGTYASLAADVAQALIESPRDYGALIEEAADMTVIDDATALSLTPCHLHAKISAAPGRILTAVAWTLVTHGWPTDAPMLPRGSDHRYAIDAVHACLSSTQIDELVAATKAPSRGARTVGAS